MKICRLILAICFFVGIAVAQDDEELDVSVSIGSVQELSVDTSDGQEAEQLKFSTQQRGDSFEGRVRVAVEMKDKEKTMYFGEVTVNAPQLKQNNTGRSPNGAIEWEFEIVTEGMKRPKITGYSVEYGIKKGKGLELLDGEFDDVDSFEELRERNTDSEALTINCTRKRPLFDNQN